MHATRYLANTRNQISGNGRGQDIWAWPPPDICLKKRPDSAEQLPDIWLMWGPPNPRMTPDIWHLCDWISAWARRKDEDFIWWYANQRRVRADPEPTPPRCHLTTPHVTHKQHHTWRGDHQANPASLYDYVHKQEGASIATPHHRTDAVFQMGLSTPQPSAGKCSVKLGKNGLLGLLRVFLSLRCPAWGLPSLGPPFLIVLAYGCQVPWACSLSVSRGAAPKARGHSLPSMKCTTPRQQDGLCGFCPC
jgi:hypothetical protein